jgi:protease-4
MENSLSNAKKMLLILGIIALIVVIGNLIFFDVSLWLTASEENCSGNVARIKLQGELVTYIPPENLDSEGYFLADQTASEDIVAAIKEAEEDSGIEAIVLEIDSIGGSVTAAEEVATALKSAGKPTVAIIRGTGYSAAYWAATGADRIFASKNSDLGSIGVTMSYLDYSKQNVKEGITYQQLSSGKFKNIGDMDKTLTEEEKTLLMRDVNILHQNFINAVAENRKLEVEKVKTLADGSSMLGQMALDNKLIDEIGGIPEVENYLKSKYNIEPDICEF